VTLSRSLALRAGAELFAKATGLVLVLVVARELGSVALGVFSVAWTTGWLLALGSDLGLHLHAAREAARREVPLDRLLGRVLLAKAVLAALALGGLAVVAPWLLPAADRPVLWCVAAALLGLSFVDLVQHALRGRARFGPDAALQVGARGAMLAGALLGLEGGALPGLGGGLLVGATLAVGAAGIVAGRWLARPTLDARPAGPLRRLYGVALPTGLGMALSVAAFRLDIYLLNALADPTSVGLYAGAYRLFEAGQLVPAVVLMVLFPRLATEDAGSRGGRRLRLRAFAALAAAGAGVAAAGWGIARPLVRALYGPGFDGAAAPLALLFWATPPMFVNALLTHDLIARARERRFAALAGGSLVLNFALNLLAIPRYGTHGAAVATVLTETALLVGSVVALRGHGPARS
jgi:O-antigen/teichoic acid export membrane protein